MKFKIMLLLTFFSITSIAQTDSIPGCGQNGNEWNVDIDSSKADGRGVLKAFELMTSTYFQITSTFKTNLPNVLNVNFKFDPNPYLSLEEKTSVKNNVLYGLKNIKGVTYGECELEVGR